MVASAAGSAVILGWCTLPAPVMPRDDVEMGKWCQVTGGVLHNVVRQHAAEHSLVQTPTTPVATRGGSGIPRSCRRKAADRPLCDPCPPPHVGG